MSWVKVDDRMAFHSKVVRAGNEAIGVWLRLTCWTAGQLTDGFIPKDVAQLIAARSQPIERLIASGLLNEVESGYQIHDYHDYNPTADEVRAKREAATATKAAAGRAGGLRSGQSRRSKSEAEAKQAAPFVLVDPLRFAEAETKQTVEAETKQNEAPSPSPSLIPTGTASPPVPEFEFRNQEASRRAKPESAELLSYFAQQWAALHSGDGRPPDLTKTDRMQASQLVKKHGLEACRGYVDRYLDDPDPWLADKGHPLAHLASRINGYRAKPPASKAPPRRDSEDLGEMAKRMGLE